MSIFISDLFSIIFMFSYLFLGNPLPSYRFFYFNILPLYTMIGCFAITLGIFAYWFNKPRDKYGLIGLKLGALTIFFAIVIITFPFPTTPPPEEYHAERAPNITWRIDNDNKTLLITSGSSTFYFAASSTDGNLVFKKGGVDYYVSSSFSLTDTESELSTTPVNAGTEITGFNAGKYIIVWEPTSKLIGEVIFA